MAVICLQSLSLTLRAVDGLCLLFASVMGASVYVSVFWLCLFVAVICLQSLSLTLRAVDGLCLLFASVMGASVYVCVLVVSVCVSLL